MVKARVKERESPSDSSHSTHRLLVSKSHQLPTYIRRSLRAVITLTFVASRDNGYKKNTIPSTFLIIMIVMFLEYYMHNMNYYIINYNYNTNTTKIINKKKS